MICAVIGFAALIFFFFGTNIRKEIPFGNLLEYEAIYDESHDNVWGIWDTGFYGYSEFAIILKSMGIIVSCNTRQIDSLLGYYKNNPEGKILIVNVAKYRQYLRGEIRSIVEFVKLGGRLLVIGEHDNMYNSSDFHNSLLSNFGITINNDYVGNSSNSERKAISKIFKLYDVYDQLAASITGPSKQTILLHGFKNKQKVPIAIGLLYGKGRVIVIGDSELFWNGDEKIGIHHGDNRLFLIRTIEWLLDQRLYRNYVSEVFLPANVLETGSNKAVKRIFIDISSGGRGVDSSISGLLHFAEFFRNNGYEIYCGQSLSQYNIRVVIGPLSQVKCEDGKDNKLLLFAEAYDEIEDHSFWDRFQLNLGYKNRQSVYRAIEEIYNLEILPCFITNGRRQRYFQYLLHEFGLEIPLHRAAAIEHGENLRTWIVSDVNAWGETIHPGMVEENQGIPFYNEFDIKTPIIAAYNNNILIIGDSDFISNTNFQKPYYYALLTNILHWMNGDYEKMFSKALKK